MRAMVNPSKPTSGSGQQRAEGPTSTFTPPPPSAWSNENMEADSAKMDDTTTVGAKAYWRATVARPTGRSFILVVQTQGATSLYIPMAAHGH